MAITTIKVSTETKARIDHLRSYKRESYDDILQKLLEILNICRFSPERARRSLLVIEKKKRRESRQAKLAQSLVNSVSQKKTQQIR